MRRKKSRKPVSSVPSSTTKAAVDAPPHLPDNTTSTSSYGGNAFSFLVEDPGSGPQTIPSELALCALLLAVSTFLSLVLLYLGQSPQQLGGGWEVWNGNLIFDEQISAAPARQRWFGSGSNDPRRCKDAVRTSGDSCETTLSSTWSRMTTQIFWSSDSPTNGEPSEVSTSSEDEDMNSEFASYASVPSSSQAIFAFPTDNLPISDYPKTRCDFERVSAHKMTTELFQERSKNP